MKYAVKKYCSFRNIPLYTMMAFLCVVITITVAAPSASIETLTAQIQEIDATISAFENELAQSNEKIGQLSLDSAQTVLEKQAVLMGIQEKVDGFNQLIAEKKTEITEIQAERATASGDSVKAVNKFNTDRTTLMAKIKQLEQMVASTTAEVAALKQKRAQRFEFSLQEVDPNGVPLHAENEKLDSILIVQQEMLNAAYARKTELTNDSSAQAELFLVASEKDNQAMQLIESELQAAETNVASAKSALGQIRATLAQKKALISDEANQLVSLKVKDASSVAKTAARINQLEISLSQIRVKAGVLQKKYEEGRTPLVTQLETVTATLQTRGQQKDIWLLMKEKHVIDSSIIAARNELDNLIQQSASGKRSAKKLADEKELELNVLLGKKDSYMSQPGVVMMEEQLKSLTLTQRHTRIEQVITNIINDISKQTTLKIQAEQALAQFDAANPIAADPSIQKYRELDSLVNMERQQSEQLKMKIDSIDFAIKGCKDSIAALDASSRNELALYENEVNAAVAQKNLIVAKREKLNIDALSSKTTTSAALKKITAEISIINQKLFAFEKDIGATKNKLTDLQNRITVSQQRFEQAKSSAVQEVGVLDGQIAEKENSAAQLSNQKLQDSEQLTILETNFQQALASSQASIGSANQSIKSKNDELEQFNSQRKILLSELQTVQSQLTSALSTLRSSTSGIKNRIVAINTNVRSLQSQRSLLLKNIQTTITTINNSINLTQKGIDASNASYNTAVEDSTNFELIRENTYLQVKASVDKQVSVIADLNTQIQMASAEFEQARIDSGAIVSAASSAMYPHIQKIHTVDSMILVKERELTQLKSERTQARQDSAAQATTARATIVSAQSLVRQKSAAISALELESAKQAKEKTRIEADAIAKGEQFKQSRQTHASTLSRHLNTIAENQQKIAQFQSELSVAENALLTIQGNSSSKPQTPIVKSTVNSSGSAQAMIEKIYTLMGENQMSAARSLFDSNKSSLKLYAPVEAIEMLESSF